MSGPATAIRDAIADRLAGFGDYIKVRKTLTPQLQAGQLPAISVAVLNEDFSADGDANVGEPRFVVTVRIGLSLMRQVNDPIAGDGQIDVDVGNVLARLLRDPTFVRFGPDSLFESVTQISSRRTFPHDGEAYFVEARQEITFETRIGFEPNLIDHYEGMTVTARPLAALGAPIADKVVLTIDEQPWT